MDLVYLNEFIVLAETCNFQEAAFQLNTSQSSLSRHIKCLEDELGTKLFERTTRKVVLNSFGRNFLQYAKTMTYIQKDYKTKMQKQMHDDKRKITVGIMPNASCYGFFELLKECMEEQNDFYREIIEANPKKLYSLLEDGICDVIFSYPPESVDREYKCIPVMVDEICAVMSVDHQLAEAVSIPMELFQEEPLMTMAIDAYACEGLMGRFKELGMIPYHIFTGHRSDEFLEMAALDIGTALIPRKLVEDHGRNDVVVHELTPRVPVTVDLIYRSSENRNLTLQWFLRKASEYAEKHFLAKE